ncbi:hypothetical protein HZA56_05805 [Candidatus Poribacteria bacterium]|nr:hypothetical protein [Candidatus Poribacteria bacterium]
MSIVIYYLCIMAVATCAVRFTSLHKYVVLPTFTSSYNDPITDNGFCLIGDSQVCLAPYRIPKIAYAGASSQRLAQLIQSIPNAAHNVTFILMAGTIDMADNASRDHVFKNIAYLESTIRSRFPDSHIVTIDPFYIQELAKKHPSFPGHLDVKGYWLLAAKYPILASH